MLDYRRIKAREVMNGDVLSLREDMPVKEAVATLADYKVSGAPVVDFAGAVVGVFSSSDVLKSRDELREERYPRQR